LRRTIELKNGITVSVVDDGYGKNVGLFEVAAWETKNPYVYITKKVWRDKAEGEDTIGWLTEKEVREFIARADKMKGNIDTRKKYRISERTGGVYSPDFRFGNSYVEGHYGDKDQRSYIDFGAHKGRALKEMSLESYQKWLEGSGYTPEQIEQKYKERDQQLETYYRKKKTTKPKPKRKPMKKIVKKCKCK
jgi:hypothetical protein